MPVSAVRVRPAAEGDLPHLLLLHEEWRAAQPGGPAASDAVREHQRASARLLFAAAIEDPDRRLLLACLDDAAVGMALLSVGSTSCLASADTLLMDHVVVTGRARHRGARRSLVVAAAAWAEERGLEAVSVIAVPTARDINRFYARLGFGPVALRRTASVATLRRRLERQAPPLSPVSHTSAAGADGVLSVAEGLDSAVLGSPGGRGGADGAPPTLPTLDRAARRQGLLARTAAARGAPRRQGL